MDESRCETLRNSKNQARMAASVTLFGRNIRKCSLSNAFWKSRLREVLIFSSITGFLAQETKFAEYYASDPVQLFFGKFKNWCEGEESRERGQWDNIRPIHFIIFTASLTTAIVLYWKFLSVWTNFYHERLMNFPSNNWLQVQYKETLSEMASFNVAEENVRWVQNATLLPEDIGAGNPSWSKKPVRNLKLSLDNARLEHAHFAKVIAESYLLIERLVVRRLPYLRSSRDRTIRDYMFKVGKEFELDDIDVRQYLILYERARFGSGHQPKMPNSTRGGAGGATASSKDHRQHKLRKVFGNSVSPHLEEDPKLINAVTFKIFLECLKRILEKIRLGYRARNRVKNVSTHRRASSDQIISNKYGGVGSRSNVPVASIKE
eukprot:jgi/Bigna1/78378/fgenesh1_pg.54_\